MSKQAAALIRERRKELGIIQWDLASQCGISKSWLSKHERDGWVHYPPPRIMNKLCEILKLDQLDVMEAMGYRTERMRRRESGGV